MSWNDSMLTWTNKKCLPVAVNFTSYLWYGGAIDGAWD